MFEQRPNRPSSIPEPQHSSHESGNGSLGLPPTLHERANPPPESHERRRLSGVWNYLEHRVKVYTPDRNRLFVDRIRQQKAVDRWMEGLRKKGTDRDRLINDLYTSITIQPGYGGRAIRELSLEEFAPFRSKVEPMTDEEIIEESRKEEEAKQRKIEESLNTNRPLTLASPKPIWEPPHPATGTFS